MFETSIKKRKTGGDLAGRINTGDDELKQRRHYSPVSWTHVFYLSSKEGMKLGFVKHDLRICFVFYFFYLF